MTSPYHVTAKQARHTILHLQGLTRPVNRKLDASGLYDLIWSLGFVQLDSIQWVERAHHMILFARNHTYRTNHLASLVERDQALFENWTHDASFIPSCFYPYWQHKFEREEAALKKKFTNWQGDGFIDHLDSLLERIEKTGPLMSRDLERPSGKQEMWQWHDGKTALEYLWRTGRLAIKARKNFQKIYDLPQRCLTPENHKAVLDREAFVDWACHSAIQRLGFGSPADIARFWDLLTIDEVKKWIKQQDGQTLRPVVVTGHDKTLKHLIARADIEDIITELSKSPAKLPGRIRALSPFDPVIRDRKRLQWLWGFDYRIEIYVPAARRIWGYYVFPLLEKDRLIGRLDMKADRAENALVVNRLWLENGVKPSATRKHLIAAELTRQARLSGVKAVKWDGNAV